MTNSEEKSGLQYLKNNLVRWLKQLDGCDHFRTEDDFYANSLTVKYLADQEAYEVSVYPDDISGHYLKKFVIKNCDDIKKVVKINYPATQKLYDANDAEKWWLAGKIYDCAQRVDGYKKQVLDPLISKSGML